MRKGMHGLFIAIMISLAIPAHGGAQQQGTLVVRAVDAATARPLPTVEVVISGGGTTTRGFTAQDGGFTAQLSAGTYTVSFTAVGFLLLTSESVTVTAGQTASITVSLAETGDIAIVDRLVVTAGRGKNQKETDAPSATYVLPARLIDMPRSTVLNALVETPGVTIIKSGVQSGYAVVRGFNNVFSGSLHALTDDRLAGVPSLRVNLLHFVPSNDDDIARIEVVQGPGSALYGPNTANGVMHVITKSPLTDQGTTLAFAGGDQEVFKGMFRTSHLLSDNFGVKLSGQYTRGRDWLFVDPLEEEAREQVIDEPLVVRANIFAQDPSLSESEIVDWMDRIGIRDRTFERYAGEIRADWRVNDDGATLIFQSGHTLADGIELTGIGAGRTENWLYSYYQTRFSWDRLFAQMYLNTSDAGESYLVRQGSPLVDKSRLFVAQAQYGLGFGSQMADGAQRQDFTFGFDAFRTTPQTEEKINGQYEDDDDVQEYGGYLQSETVLSNKLDFVAAARLDKSSLLDESVFSPRVALVFQPEEGHALRVTYNRAFSMPTTLNYFLDINAGVRGAGLYGRALGTGKDGFSFQDASGALRGMRSPYTPMALGGPGQLLPDAASTHGLLWQTLLGVGVQTQIMTPQEFGMLMGVDGSGLGLLLVDPVDFSAFPVTPGAVPDTPALRESTNETFEVGYKGLINDRFAVAADVWYQERKNFISPLVPRTPLIILNPAEVIGLMIQGGIDPARAEQIVLQSQEAFDDLSLGTLPLAVVSSGNVITSTADIVASYVNSKAPIDLWGWDASLRAQLTDEVMLEVSASGVSDDFFVVRKNEEGIDEEVENVDQVEGAAEVLSLNAPDFYGALTLSYNSDESGISGHARIRHTAEFPVNSADFVGLGCIPGLEVGMVIRDCVESSTLLDVGIAYRLPNWENAQIQLDIQNVLDNGYRSFVGVPHIGRFAMIQLRYAFGSGS